MSEENKLPETDPNALITKPGDVVIIWGRPFLVSEEGLSLLTVDTSADKPKDNDR